MALLVSDNGELQSLRYLVNSDRNIPRNLILKLYTSNTVPTETDVPSSEDHAASDFDTSDDDDELAVEATTFNPDCDDGREDENLLDEYDQGGDDDQDHVSDPDADDEEPERPPGWKNRRRRNRRREFRRMYPFLTPRDEDPCALASSSSISRAL